MATPFLIKSCTLAAIATGDYAHTIVSLCDKLTTIQADSLYYHFWGERLFAHFVNLEYHNDFAMWVHKTLHDEVLAEQLSILDPTEYASLDALRVDLIEIIERRINEYTVIPLSKKDEAFHFVRSEIIIYETPYSFDKPEEMAKVIPLLSPGSFFFHFIDARSRTPHNSDDFSNWLETFGDRHSTLIDKLRSIDSYFLSLSALKEEVVRVVANYFEGKNG